MLPRREREKLDCLTVAGVWSKSHWPPETLKDYSPNVNNEDINMVNMVLENGVHACYLQCHYTPDACRNYTVIGTKGRLENYSDGGDDCRIEVWTRRIDGFSLDGDITYRMPKDDGAAHGGADPQIVKSFIEMIRGNGSPASTPQGARYAVAAGLLGAQSIRNGGMPYDVPALPEELENYDFSLNK